MTLFLVRHGRPSVDRDRPASAWDLDPAGFDDIWALRESGRLPARAAWFCSPEPKAQQTAQLLTDGGVGIVEELREHERAAGWLDDFPDRVRAAFADPSTPAAPGWEPLDACRERLVPAVRRILDVHGDDDVVLVGHGTAWTALVATLTGREPDLTRWASLGMPDVIELPTVLR
ncbi:histidine phosphatase family protein [Nocardioides sp. P5_C9_2]